MQLTLNFESGLTAAYPTCLEYVAARIHQQGRPQKAVAADMDLSPSDLSRKLADTPNRTLSLNDFERYITVTGDTKPVLYLVEKFLAGGDKDAIQQQIAELQQRLKAIK